ncbi:hypothetical protein CAEBREN_11658 [Caenorhabditis brenneri]|uniref:Switch protein XOL-1 GHMP-like domain-containing protein n=1 Tax=Caenorhabditis brenneri TaxID=135651 RepID=G0MW93_CAEBE|nr:hypothetical protein CAEBREN_11658 [Caenorhabditis brenneri]
MRGIITKVDKEHVFDPGFDSKDLPEGTHLFTAPYTMHFLDGAHLALNRCLSIEARINNKSNHKLTFAGPAPPTGMDEIINYAFTLFRAIHHYDMIINGIYDYERNVAYMQLIACISKLVIKIEEKHIMESTIDAWIFNVLDKFKIAPGSPKAIRQAVLHGGYDVVYMEPAEGKEILDCNEPVNTLLYLSFHYDYDVYFVRTNLHPSNFKKSLKPNRKCLDHLVRNNRRNFGTHMMEYWKSRMTHEDCTKLQKECDAAIQDYIENNQNGPIIHGYESQQGGLLLVVPKESFKDEKFLTTLSYKLEEQCTGEITQVSFDHLEPGPPT